MVLKKINKIVNLNNKNKYYEVGQNLDFDTIVKIKQKLGIYIIFTKGGNTFVVDKYTPNVNKNKVNVYIEAD